MQQTAPVQPKPMETENMAPQSRVAPVNKDMQVPQQYGRRARQPPGGGSSIIFG